MLQFRLLQIAFGIFLSIALGSCAHGPELNVCASNPDLSRFDCSMPSSWIHHPSPTAIAYADTKGLSVYPPTSFQAIEDYCAARAEPATQPPNFVACAAKPDQGGVECAEVACELIPAGSGISCRTGSASFVLWFETLDYIGLSQTDNETLLAYCNIASSGGL